MKERLLTAFFHRGRKQFVPWLASELSRRVKRSPDDVDVELRGLDLTGMARSRATDGHSQTSTWELTQAGMIEARAIMAAAEVVRSA